MKDNDLVKRVIKHQRGETLAHNFSTSEEVISFMNFEYRPKVKFIVSTDPLNEGKLAPVADEDWEEVYEGKINWAVDNVASITSGERTFITEDFVGEGWVVIQEAPLPSQTAQEKAAGMTVEELRASIETLKGLRARPASVKKSRASEVGGSPSDPLALALSKLSPEQVAKIKAKLGLSI